MIAVHIYQIDHQALSKNAQRNTDEDKDLTALGILHEYAYEDGGNLECHTESIARQVLVTCIFGFILWAYSMRVAWPGLKPPAT